MGPITRSAQRPDGGLFDQRGDDVLEVRLGDGPRLAGQVPARGGRLDEERQVRQAEGRGVVPRRLITQIRNYGDVFPQPPVPAGEARLGAWRLVSKLGRSRLEAGCGRAFACQGSPGSSIEPPLASFDTSFDAHKREYETVLMKRSTQLAHMSRRGEGQVLKWGQVLKASPPKGERGG